LRCLKRYIARETYRAILLDARAYLPSGQQDRSGVNKIGAWRSEVRLCVRPWWAADAPGALGRIDRLTGSPPR
jgi:hypothetical protein